MSQFKEKVLLIIVKIVCGLKKGEDGVQSGVRLAESWKTL